MTKNYTVQNPTLQLHPFIKEHKKINVMKSSFLSHAHYPDNKDLVHIIPKSLNPKSINSHPLNHRHGANKKNTQTHTHTHTHTNKLG